MKDRKCKNDLCFHNKQNLTYIRMDQEENFDPSLLWYQGCQFIGMNYSIAQDDNLKTTKESGLAFF